MPGMSSRWHGPRRAAIPRRGRAGVTAPRSLELPSSWAAPWLGGSSSGEPSPSSGCASAKKAPHPEGVNFSPAPLPDLNY